MKIQNIENIKKFGFEFFTIVIGIFAAFALDNWNENRKDKNTEKKILREINIGLTQDIKDLNINEFGQNQGIRAVNIINGFILNENLRSDSTVTHYFNLFRSFISVQNKSGYETLKSKGLELIENDSLRSEILSLYENDYNSIKKLEESYSEIQFFEHYSRDFNNSLTQYFIFDSNGEFIGINQPIKLAEKDRKLLLTHLWRIKNNRNFMIRNYVEVKKKVKKLQENIELELNRLNYI